tara:strand:- start:543 stop:770 length:228 start_codon:yes stop_codon:yes gene_type:complete
MALKDKSEIKTASGEELLTWYHNCRTTAARCGGHGKANMNDIFAEIYRTEMKRRGMTIPAKNDWGNGKYAGEGAY